MNKIGTTNRKRLEQDLVGIGVLEPKAVDLFSLDSDDLFHEDCKVLYSAVKQMSQKNMAIDATSLSEYLEDQGKLDKAGGPSHIAQCMNGVPSVDEDTIETREKQIRKDNQKRKLYEMGERIKQEINQSSSNKEVIEYARSTLDDIEQYNQDSNIFGPDDLIGKLDNVFQSMSRRMDNPGQLPDNYLSTGIMELDSLTNGLGPGEFVVISGPAKAGKTTLANQILMQATNDPDTTGYLESLEMSAADVLELWIHSVSEVSRSRSLWGEMDQDELDRMVKKSVRMIHDHSMYLAVPSGATVYDFINRCRRVKRNHNADFALLDYFQFLKNPRPEEMSPYEHYEMASHRLREAAKQLDMVLIVVSRLNRAGETYGTSATDYDLTTSIKVDFMEAGGDDSRIISVPRVRSGPGGNIYCRLVGEQARFTDFEKEV